MEGSNSAVLLFKKVRVARCGLDVIVPRTGTGEFVGQKGAHSLRKTGSAPSLYFLSLLKVLSDVRVVLSLLVLHK
jgi:hypothetical protein